MPFTFVPAFLLINGKISGSIRERPPAIDPIQVSSPFCKTEAFLKIQDRLKYLLTKKIKGPAVQKEELTAKDADPVLCYLARTGFYKVVKLFHSPGFFSLSGPAFEKGEVFWREAVLGDKPR